MKTNKKLQQIVIIITLLVFLISCTQEQTTLSKTTDQIPVIEQPAEKTEITTVKDTNNSTVETTEIKQPEPIIEKTKQTAPVVAIKKQNPEKVTVKQPTVIEFTISADEKQFNPDTITIKKGDKVKIRFNFNDDNIYFGGLDIKSQYFNTNYRKSDQIKTKTVEFTAEKSFSYIGYWPATSAKKAVGKVVVE